eukprot:1146119-Pelagomonas_calceolata.AAC.2
MSVTGCQPSLLQVQEMIIECKLAKPADSISAKLAKPAKPCTGNCPQVLQDISQACLARYGIRPRSARCPLCVWRVNLATQQHLRATQRAIQCDAPSLYAKVPLPTFPWEWWQLNTTVRACDPCPSSRLAIELQHCFGAQKCPKATMSPCAAATGQVLEACGLHRIAENMICARARLCVRKCVHAAYHHGTAAGACGGPLKLQKL